MVAPLAIISLISTASDVISGISKLVSSNTGAESAGSSGSSGNDIKSVFSNLVGSSQSSQSSTGTQSTLDVTPQGSAPQLTAQGAALIRADSAQAGITAQTIDAINNILSGKGTPTDINTLSNNVSQNDRAESSDDTSSDTNTAKVNILGNTKLDDPFGIKAAEANAAQIAAPLIVPADSNAGLVPLANTDITTSASDTVNTAGIQANSNVIKQSDNPLQIQLATTADKNNAGKDKIFKLAENADSTETQNIQSNNALKTNDAAAQVGTTTDPNSVATANDKTQNKDSLLNTNPNATGILANSLEPKSIGEAVRAMRAKDDVKEKLASIDTYKIVSVSKKDNVIDLRLEPSQLGKVQIKLDFSDGKANIMVTADRPETLNLLQKDTKTLEKILTDNGINADSSSLSFDLRGQQQQQHQNNDGFNFFTGKPLSFRVEEQISNMTAANDVNNLGYNNYGGSAANGMLNIIV